MSFVSGRDSSNSGDLSSCAFTQHIFPYVSSLPFRFSQQTTNILQTPRPTTHTDRIHKLPRPPFCIHKKFPSANILPHTDSPYIQTARPHGPYIQTLPPHGPYRHMTTYHFRSTTARFSTVTVLRSVLAFSLLTLISCTNASSAADDPPVEPSPQTRLDQVYPGFSLDQLWSQKNLPRKECSSGSGGWFFTALNGDKITNKMCYQAYDKSTSGQEVSFFIILVMVRLLSLIFSKLWSQRPFPTSKLSLPFGE